MRGDAGQRPQNDYRPPARTQSELAEAGELPPWLGDADFHRSHRSALLRKDPAHYRPFFPDVPDDLPYVWPASGRQRRTFDDR